jgi:putative oxidoreductase
VIWGSVALMIFIIPATLIFHAFWKYQGYQALQVMLQFMSNIAVFGGLLLVINWGARPLSIDNPLAKKKSQYSSLEYV